MLKMMLMKRSYLQIHKVKVFLTIQIIHQRSSVRNLLLEILKTKVLQETAMVFKIRMLKI